MADKNRAHQSAQADFVADRPPGTQKAGSIDTTAFFDPSLALGSVTTWLGTTRVLASPKGTRQIWLPNWHQKHSQEMQISYYDPAHIDIVQSGEASAEHHLRRALEELACYFAGERREFTVALDMQGTAFYRHVWQIVAQVPYGETRTYGEIAREAGTPIATRAVGAANGANPLAPIVPCHRIIASDGKLRDYGPGLPLKQRLLAMEGALPATPADYAAWAARLDDDVLLGVRATRTICRPDCARPRRYADRPHRIFHTLAAAHDAGFHPCALCAPAPLPGLFPSEAREGETAS